MNRTDICKNIIQSIKEYITNPDKLEAHRKMKLAEVCTSEFNNSLIAIINKTGWVNNHNTAIAIQKILQIYRLQLFLNNPHHKRQ